MSLKNLKTKLINNPSLAYSKTVEFIPADKGEDPPTYSRGSSWGGHATPTINLENSSWFFSKNQKRSKPQGSLEITSQRLGHGDLVFETLYTNDQQSKDDKYGPKLEHGVGNTGYRGNEPYIIRQIPESNKKSPYAYTSQLNPFTQNTADNIKRTELFLKSNAGITFTANQNLLGTFQKYKPLYSPTSTLTNVAFPKEGLITPLLSVPRNFPIKTFTYEQTSNGEFKFTSEEDKPYSEYLNIRARNDDIKSGKITYSEYNKNHTPVAYQVAKGPLKSLSKAFNDITKFGGDALEIIAKKKIKTEGDLINSINNVNTSIGSTTTTNPLGNIGTGDKFTLFPMENFDGKSIDSSTEFVSGLKPNSSQNGMPFYFRDLRDGIIIFFRAYIDGISDTISPNWSPENYIGRSEPVYTYTGGERELQFNLKLFANTKNELNMIYKKMNRLTSLCYPEYKPLDVSNNISTDNGNLDLLKAEKNVSNDSRIIGLFGRIFDNIEKGDPAIEPEIVALRSVSPIIQKTALELRRSRTERNNIASGPYDAKTKRELIDILIAQENLLLKTTIELLADMEIEYIFDKTWGIFPGMLLGTAEDSVKRNPRESK